MRRLELAQEAALQASAPKPSTAILSSLGSREYHAIVRVPWGEVLLPNPAASPAGKTGSGFVPGSNRALQTVASVFLPAIWPN